MAVSMQLFPFSGLESDSASAVLDDLVRKITTKMTIRNINFLFVSNFFINV